jgi:hypothetical protein
MNVWMEMKQALTVIDLATRNWGRQLRLTECAVMVLALLGEGGAAPECDLSASCGRSRQQVHGALLLLAKRRYATRLVVDGRTRAWELTERGRELWACLDRGIREFEGELEARLDVSAFKTDLDRLVTVFLNRPRANGGWRFGLCVPVELLKTPMWAEASFKGLVDVEEALPDDDEVDPEPELRAPPGIWPKPWSAADREFFRSYWKRMEQDDDEEPSVEVRSEGMEG